MIDLEVLPELTSGTEVGKERKKRLEVSLSLVSLKISHLELVASCLFLPLSCSLLASSRCDVVCRRLVHPSSVKGTPPSLSLAHSFFAISHFRHFSLQRKPPTSI